MIMESDDEVITMLIMIDNCDYDDHDDHDDYDYMIMRTTYLLISSFWKSFKDNSWNFSIALVLSVGKSACIIVSYKVTEYVKPRVWI